MQLQMTKPIRKSYSRAKISCCCDAGGGRAETYADKFIEEHLPQVRASRRVEREDACEALGCEHDSIPLASREQHLFGSLGDTN